MPVDWDQFEPVMPAAPPAAKPEKAVDWTQFKPVLPGETDIPKFEAPSDDYVNAAGLAPQDLLTRMRTSPLATRFLGPPVENPSPDLRGASIGVAPVLMSAPLPFAPAPESVLGKAMLGYFIGKFAMSQPEAIPAIKNAYDKGDWTEFRQLVGDEAFGAAFTGLAGHGFLKEGSDWRGLQGVYGEQFKKGPGIEPTVTAKGQTQIPERVTPVTGQDLRMPPGAQPSDPFIDVEGVPVPTPEGQRAIESGQQPGARLLQFPPTPAPTPPPAGAPAAPPQLDPSQFPPAPQKKSQFIRIQTADGQIIPAYYEGGYMEIPGVLDEEAAKVHKQPWISYLTPKGEWTTGLLHPGDKVLDPIESFDEWKARATGVKPSQPPAEQPPAPPTAPEPPAAPTPPPAPPTTQPGIPLLPIGTQPPSVRVPSLPGVTPPAAPTPELSEDERRAKYVQITTESSRRANPNLPEAFWSGPWKVLMEKHAADFSLPAIDLALRLHASGMSLHIDTPETHAIRNVADLYNEIYDAARNQNLETFSGEFGEVSVDSDGEKYTFFPVRHTLREAEINAGNGWHSDKGNILQVPIKSLNENRTLAHIWDYFRAVNEAAFDEDKAKEDADQQPPTPPAAPPTGLPPAPTPPPAAPAPPEPPPATPPAESTAVAPSMAAAQKVLEHLNTGQALTKAHVEDVMAGTHGGSLAKGTFTAKDLTDVVELAVNLWIFERGELFNPGTADAATAGSAVAQLKDLLTRLPTQTTRTQETDQMQQFSTPPTEGYVAAWVAKPLASDKALEPSAGIFGLGIFLANAGATVYANELSERRRGFLEALQKQVGSPNRVTGHNAELLHALMIPEINQGHMQQPTLVLMNPPFSQSALADIHRTSIGAQHVEQALKLLADGGRLVAVVGEGMGPERPSFTAWWKKIKGQYNVRANVNVSGEEYRKYGTTFGNQLVVIDKTGPTPEGGTVTGKAEKVEDLIPLLEKVRNERPTPQPKSSQPGRPAAPPQGTPPAQRPVNAPPSTGGSGSGTGGGSGGTGGRPAPQVGGGLGPKPKTPTVSPGKPPGPGNPPADPNRPPGEVSGPPGSVPPPAPGIDVETKPAAQRELSETGIFSVYVPAKVHVPGTSPHPAPLVESTSMASVEPVDPTYKPSLSPAAIKFLSDEQMENIIYAGQAHEKFLPTGERQGYFIGDGTGVGKGAQIAGIFADNHAKGRVKGMWVSAKADLIKAAQRDFNNVGLDPKLLIDFGKGGGKKIIGTKEGMAFVTYTSLSNWAGLVPNTPEGQVPEMNPDQDPEKPSRIRLFRDWAGKDFDGVIIFDESHYAGNAVDMRGDRGIERASERGKMVVAFQAMFPKARIGYVSATGATDVVNLSYADRLGIWGPGTPFPNKMAFFNAISASGLSAMEIVARDLKAQGKYLARTLSFTGIEQTPLPHKLTPDQVKLYDEVSRAWQLVLSEINSTMAQTGQANNGRARGSVTGKFWGAQQRFYNQLLTAMQTPTIIEQIKRSLAAGNAAVIQLTNTNEATLTRELAKKGAESDEGDTDWLEDLDLSPKDILMDYVDKHYPTQLFAAVTDDNGNTRWDPQWHPDGRPVLDPSAVEAKQRMLDHIKLMRAPSNPIEMILDTFGTENVAEITGRSVRVVNELQPDGTRKRVKQSRSNATRSVEHKEFNDDKRRILIFSEAGGTGFDYHSSRTFINQRQRDHIGAQLGWRADTAVQGYGRTNRTNQAHLPHYYTPSTDIPGHKRFISTIMRRLQELGALTGGERKAATQELFNESDDLETPYAAAAAHTFFRRLFNGEYDDLSWDDVCRKMGFTKKFLNNQTGEIEESNDLVDRQSGGLKVTALPPIHKFLNRVLVLEKSDQDRVFKAFGELLETIIDNAKADGSYDPGTQKLRAVAIRKVKDEVVYSDPNSTAKTRLVEIEHDEAVKTHPWEKINEVAPDRPVIQFVKNIRSGKVFALKEGPTRTMENGNVVDTWRRISPTGADIVGRNTVMTEQYFSTPANYETLETDAAKALWEEQIAKAPKVKTHTDTYVVGAFLPVWDRLQLSRPRIWRITTDKGENLLGAHVPTTLVAGLRERMGAGAGEQPTPKMVFDRVLGDGQSIELANGWVIKRSRVAGDKRIEVRGIEYNQIGEFTGFLGGFTERIAGEPRFFISADEDTAIDSLTKILRKSPAITRQPGIGGAPQTGYFDRSSEAFGMGRISGAPSLEEIRAHRASELSGGAIAEPLIGNQRLYSGIPMPMTLREMAEFIGPIKDASAFARTWWRGFAMKQAPRITDADRETGEAGVRYAAAPFVARQLGIEFAAKVMAGITERGFDLQLGTAISEDNLRDIKQRNLDLAEDIRHREENISLAQEEISNFAEDAADGDPYARRIIRNLKAQIERLQGYTDEDADRVEELAKNTFTFIGKPGSPFKTEAEYTAFLGSDEARQVLERHRNMWREQKDPLFRLASDLDPDTKLETRGLQTDARINLKPMVEGDKPSKTTVGTTRSPLTKQSATFKRKNPFSYRAEGQGTAYEGSYTELMAHGFEREYPIAAQHEFLRKIIETGNATVSTRESAPNLLLQDEATKGYLMKLRPWAGRWLQVRKSLAPEYEAITGLTPAARIPYYTKLGEFFTRQSIVGLAEGSTHMANLLMEVFTGLGPTANPMINALMKSVGRADLLYKLPKVLITAFQDRREEMLELAKIGAAKQPYHGILGKLLTMADQGVRINSAEIYRKMAAAGWVEDTETGLREFVNQLGNYNKKLQPYLVRWLRDTQVSPFITAGQTFNVMGMRRMVGAPGAKAPSVYADAALRMDILAGWLGFLALVAAINYLITGKAHGPKGTKLGAIGWIGDEGKLHQLDLGLLTGFSRGPRLTGLQAITEARRQGLSGNSAMMAGMRSLGNTAISTVAGPLNQFAVKAVTGKRPGVPMVQEAKVVPPQDKFAPFKSQMSENIKTALRQANPAVDGVASIIEGKPTMDVLNRQLSRYTPRVGMSPDTIANLPRIVKQAEINAYADALAKESRKVPLGQRVKWITERLTSDQLPPEVQARTMIELRRRGAYSYQ